MHKSSMEKMNWFKNKYLDDFDNIHILDVGSLDNSGNNYNYRFSKIYLFKVYGYIVRFVDRSELKASRKIAKELTLDMIDNCDCNGFNKFILRITRIILSCVTVFKR